MTATITAEAKKRMLEALLPDDQPIYLGLLLELDSVKEVADPSYQRAASSAWETVPDGSARHNTATIGWPAMQAQVVARAVGFFDAPSGGKLLVVLPTRTLLGEESELVIGAGDLAQLPVGSLRIRI